MNRNTDILAKGTNIRTYSDKGTHSDIRTLKWKITLLGKIFVCEWNFLKLFINLPWYMPRLHAKFEKNWCTSFRENWRQVNTQWSILIRIHMLISRSIFQVSVSDYQNLMNLISRKKSVKSTILLLDYIVNRFHEIFFRWE